MTDKEYFVKFDMELTDLTEEAKYFLNILEALVSSPYNVKLVEHSKAVRDIMDNLEGHLHRVLNRNGRYDHSTLKENAPHMSEKAYALREHLNNKQKFLSLTHREHAKPFKIIMAEIAGLKGKELLNYVSLNVKSVTILKEERDSLDSMFKTTMPNVTDIFSRFKAVGIVVVSTNT